LQFDVDEGEGERGHVGGQATWPFKREGVGLVGGEVVLVVAGDVD